MDPYNIIGAICAVVALINSEPYLWLLIKLRLINYTLFTCGLCFGAWIGAIYSFINLPGEAILPFTGMISIGSELLNSIIKKWNL